MQTYQGLSRSSLADLWLAFEAMILISISAFVIRFCSFRFVGLIASQTIDTVIDDSDRQARMVQRVSLAVQAVARRSIFRAQCFEQALTAQFMLRRRGYDAILYFGAGTGPRRPLEAHVWVRLDQFDVVGTENAHDYAPLTHFPSQGS